MEEVFVCYDHKKYQDIVFIAEDEGQFETWQEVLMALWKQLAGPIIQKMFL